MNKLQYLIVSILVITCILSLYTLFDMRQEMAEIEKELKITEAHNEIYQDGLYSTLERVRYKGQLLDEYEENYLFYKQRTAELEELFEQIFMVEATAYAPIDPQAVEGMCYSGDPWVTASGFRSNPDISIAMDPKFPFGSRVLVEGFGERIIHDRGGAITGNKIDIMMWTLEEVMSFGRRSLRVIVLED
ncbi:MAG: 3D domain-containing protein [Candidatus Caldatribacteriota bacterium]